MSKRKRNSSRREYRRGAFVAIIVLITGILFEIVNGGKGVSLPSWPMNLFAGISFAFILVFIHLYYREFSVVRFLSRVPASISAIILFTFLTLILGLTQQNQPDASSFMKYTGLSHIRTSYVFLLSGLYLLTALGLVILRRITPVNYRNLGFTLNHLGLWIIVLSGSLGAGDLQRLNIYVNEGEKVWYGYNQNRQPVQLPFQLQLIDFDIDYFNPKLALIEMGDMSIPQDVDNNLTMIDEGMQIELKNWNVRISEFIKWAQKDSLGKYVPKLDTMSFALAKLEVEGPGPGFPKTGWITSGSALQEPVLLRLNERFALAMTHPEPREYSSLLAVDYPGKDRDTARLVVNEPVKVKGWNLYQLSYDERKGKWSNLSILEAVKDPWLPIVYLGIFMVISGAMYLFTIGKTPKEKKNELD